MNIIADLKFAMLKSDRIVFGTIVALGAGALTYWHSYRGEKNEKNTNGSDGFVSVQQGSGGQIIRDGNVEIIQGKAGQIITRKKSKSGQTSSGRPSIFKACLCGALTGSMVLGLLKFSENTSENGTDFALASIFGVGALCVNQSDDNDWNDTSDISFCIIV